MPKNGEFDLYRLNSTLMPVLTLVYIHFNSEHDDGHSKHKSREVGGTTRTIIVTIGFGYFDVLFCQDKSAIVSRRGGLYCPFNTIYPSNY